MCGLPSMHMTVNCVPRRFRTYAFLFIRMSTIPVMRYYFSAVMRIYV